jgi:DNA-binding transcriptional MerR regulator
LNKAPDAFRTISEVADELDLPQHVLRFWESRFPHIRPMKRGGGRRYYRPEDVDLLRGIRHLLYGDGYTIRGVQRILREQGVRTVQSVGQGHAVSLAVQRDGAPSGDEPEGAPRDATKDARSDAPKDALDARRILSFLPRFAGGPAAADEGPGEDGEIGEAAPASPTIAPPRRPKVEVRLPEVKAPEIKSPVVQSPTGPPEPKSSVADQAAQAVLPSDPPPKGLAGEDLDRLKRALADLDACRRLLDKANEGGR